MYRINPHRFAWIVPGVALVGLLSGSAAAQTPADNTKAKTQTPADNTKVNTRDRATGRRDRGSAERERRPTAI